MKKRNLIYLNFPNHNNDSVVIKRSRYRPTLLFLLVDVFIFVNLEVGKYLKIICELGYFTYKKSL